MKERDTGREKESGNQTHANHDGHVANKKRCKCKFQSILPFVT